MHTVLKNQDDLAYVSEFEPRLFLNHTEAGFYVKEFNSINGKYHVIILNDAIYKDDVGL